MPVATQSTSKRRKWTVWTWDLGLTLLISWALAADIVGKATADFVAVNYAGLGAAVGLFVRSLWKRFAWTSGRLNASGAGGHIGGALSVLSLVLASGLFVIPLAISSATTSSVSVDVQATDAVGQYALPRVATITSDDYNETFVHFDLTNLGDLRHRAPEFAVPIGHATCGPNRTTFWPGGAGTTQELTLLCDRFISMADLRHVKSILIAER